MTGVPSTATGVHSRAKPLALGATLIHPGTLPGFAVAMKAYQIDGRQGNHEEDPLTPLRFRVSLVKIGFVFVRVVSSIVNAERTRSTKSHEMTRSRSHDYNFRTTKYG